MKITYIKSSDQSSATNADETIINAYGSSINENNEPVLYLIRTERVSLTDLNRELSYVNAQRDDLLAKKAVIEEVTK